MRKLDNDSSTVHLASARVWGAVVFLCLVGLAQPFAASASPSISIDRIWPTRCWSWTSPSVVLSMVNRDQPVYVDVYIGLLLPDGSLYAADQTVWTTALTPWAPNVLIPSALNIRDAWFKLPDIPAGIRPTDGEADCCLLAGLTDPGTLNFKSHISLKGFRLLSEQPREQNIGSVAQQVLLMGIRAQRYYWTPCSEGGGGQSFTGIGMWEVGPAQNEDGDTLLIFSASCSSVGIMGTCSVAVADDGTPVTVVADVTAEEIRVSINE